MPPIFINTDNSNKKKRIFIGDKAGAGSADVEDKIRAQILKIIEPKSEFTTNKIDDPKGYTLFCEVTEFSASGGDTSIKIVIEIIRFPATYSKGHGKKGEKVMTSGELSGKGAASGKNGLSDAIEAIMQTIVPKTFPVMIADMARR
ncbi:MAG: hypothetical protein ACJ72Z_03975 [Pyrinomonadaceae bacterium]